MNKPFLPYHVTPKGKRYAVYKWEDEKKLSADKVLDSLTYEAAKEAAYNLNGEYFKQLKNKITCTVGSKSE